ncbi:MAG: 6-carboxy-5,6,7,8-tetrahydropterin synthase [Smithella sp. PtaU1.Bin162]|nr:MAG: 6-carboxy-5,6,7,8-tetrahydropterin synthase [Smithella sp. PtaU1.Bin162]
MEIFKVFHINSAHRLPNVPPGHKCANLHGHSFRIEVHIKGPVHPRLGWVIDFADIAKAFQPLHDRLDHKYLNDIEGLANPTSENLAKWLWQNLQPALPQLSKIVVQESPESGCVYEGEQ